MTSPANAREVGDPDPGLRPTPGIPHQSLAAVFLRFLRFGSLAWGGPIAQIAMIQRELVDEQRWISHDRFRRALAVYQVLPGPEAHELCVYFGMLARGRTGAILAGLGFMLPGLVLMLGLSVLYANGTLQVPALRPLFLGLQAAVVAVIVRALLRIGHHALHDRWLVGIGLAAGAATLVGVHFGVVLLCGGLCAMLQQQRRWLLALLAAVGFVAWMLYVWLAGPEAAELANAAPATTTHPAPLALFTSGLRSGLLTFGGAYTVIPFLQQDAVVTGAWMTNDQFLEAVALSGVLPAPMIIFATLVGYVGGGLAGALLMTAGIFLPAFCFTLLGHGLFERITGNASVHRLLDGVTAAVVGIMFATTLGLMRAGISDLGGAVIAVVVFAMLWFWKHRAAVPVAVLAGGAMGLALFRG